MLIQTADLRAVQHADSDSWPQGCAACWFRLLTSGLYGMLIQTGNLRAMRHADSDWPQGYVACWFRLAISGLCDMLIQTDLRAMWHADLDCRSQGYAACWFRLTSGLCGTLTQDCHFQGCVACWFRLLASGLHNVLIQNTILRTVPCVDKNDHNKAVFQLNRKKQAGEAHPQNKCEEHAGRRPVLDCTVVNNSTHKLKITKAQATGVWNLTHCK